MLVLRRCSLIGLLRGLIGGEHRSACLLKRLRVSLIDRLLDFSRGQSGYIDIADFDAGIRTASMCDAVDGQNDDKRDCAHGNDSSRLVVAHKLEPRAQQSA